ncbi:sigma-70 family RNA polymerase sigma factor [Candidatus Poribacteria bacterium]
MRTEDGSIIQECLDGKPEAFGMLVDKYKAGVYAFVYGRLGHFQNAQDVTQEVFVEAYRGLHSLRRWESFVFWLYRIARNHCVDWLKIESRRPDSEFIEDQKPSIIETPSLDAYRDGQLTESLNEALDALPNTYREVLVMHYFGGMAIKDIARAVGASPAAIGKRLSRARSQLREEMIAMMDTAFDGQRLQASFTFRIVEVVKRIKVHPMPRTAGLPWGVSLAAGLIITILGLNSHLHIPSSITIPTVTSPAVEAKALRIGEVPIDIVKVSETSLITKQSNGDGSDAFIPDLQNALSMAPQAEGGKWTRKADMLTARESFGCSMVNNRIYAVGGGGGGRGPMALVEEYDPLSDKWVRKSDMLTKRMYLSSSVVEGKIYAIGGMIWAGADVALPAVEEYDPVTDKWTKKADMPTERQNLTTSAVNGKIYAIGGLKWDANKSVVLPTVEEYDPAADKWTKKADMPTPRHNLSTSVVDEKIYAIGGTDGNRICSIVEEYDPAADKWTKKTDMPTARRSLITGVVNGKIYAIGGWENWPISLSTVEEYDPMTDKWTEKAGMPSARVYISASESNGRIYVMGGLDPAKNVHVSIVEEYDPEAEGESIDLKGKLPTTWGEVRTASSR